MTMLLPETLNLLEYLNPTILISKPLSNGDIDVNFIPLLGCNIRLSLNTTPMDIITKIYDKGRKDGIIEGEQNKIQQIKSILNLI